MNKLSILKSESVKLSYQGKASEFVLVYFKNLLLVIPSLGLYYPWAKIKIVEFHSKSTQLNNTGFLFSGKAKEIFNSFMLIYLLYFTTIVFAIWVSLSENFRYILSVLIIVFFINVLIFPFIIHGTAKYQYSNTSWKGIRFHYLGDKFELFWKFLTGHLLSLLTLGIYYAWFHTDIVKYLYSHLRFGNLSFNFTGKGKDLFLIHLKNFILFPLTLGIYTFWYGKNLLKFFADNIEITQNGKKTLLTFNIKIGDVFHWLFINILLYVISLGLAYPLIAIRTQRFIFRFIEVDKTIDLSAVQQTKYKSTKKHPFLELNLV
ncbi:MAG: DUF898 family protein [Tenacibaculum sp.]